MKQIIINNFQFILRKHLAINLTMYILIIINLYYKECASNQYIYIIHIYVHKGNNNLNEKIILHERQTCILLMHFYFQTFDGIINMSEILSPNGVP